MKKKSLLSAGAIALALGLGVAAMSAGSLLSLPFAAVLTADETTATLDYKGAIPANETVLPDWQSIKSCQFEFTDLANPGTFPGLVVNRNCTEKIKVLRSTFGGTFYDDQVIWEIDPSDANSVYVDSKYATRLTVVFPEELSLYNPKMNNFTYYKVIVPAGVAVKDSNSTEMNPDDPGTVTPAANAEVSVEYTVKKMPQYSTTPASNQTVSTMNGGLLEASVNYVAGTTVEMVNTSAVATLYYCDPSGAKASAAGDKVGTYTMSIDGSSVKLTLEGGEQPALPATRCYYKIVIPESSFSAKGASDFWSTDNPKIVIDNINMVWLDASVIEFLDEDDEPAARTYENTTDFPTVFYTMFPGKIALYGANLNSAAGLYPAGSTSAVAMYNGTLLPNGTTVEWKMVAASSATSKVGRPEWWSPGKYEFAIAKNKFKDPTTNTALDKTVFSGIEFENGLTNDPVVDWKVNVTTTYRQKINDVVTAVLQDQLYQKDQLAAIPAEKGFTCARFQFLTGVKPNLENTSASATISKKGDANALVEVHPEATVNKAATEEEPSHLWYGTGNASTSATYLNKAVSAMSYQTSWELWYNLSGEKAYTSTTITATTTAYYLPDVLKTPGTYVVHVDPGFFVDKDGILSAEVEYEFTIIGDIKTTVAPESDMNVDELDEITITYPEDCKVNVPENTKIKLEIYPQVNTAVLPEFIISGKDNVVTLKAETPFSTPSKNQYRLNIPGGTWTVAQDGSSQPNAAFNLVYKITNVPGGEVTPSTTEPLLGSDLASILYKSPINLYSVADGTALYKVEAGEAGATATRTKVASYTSSIPSDAEGNPIMTQTCTWTTSEDLSELEAGTYEFVIPAGAVTVRGNGSNATSEKAFTYTYTVLPPKPKFAKLMKLVDPAETTITKWPGAEPYFGFDANNASDNIALASESVLANLDLKLLYNGEQIASWKGNDAVNTFDEPMGPLGAYLEIQFGKLANLPDVKKAGVYTLVIPDGLLTLDGEPVIGASYEITMEKPQIDFTYTLDPAAGTEVKTLESIILNFPNASDIKYYYNAANPIATLTNEAGTVKVDCESTTTDFNNTITLHFGDSNTEWISGKYTLTVHKGIINLGDANWDDSDVSLGTGNFEGLTAEYTLDYSAGPQMGEISDHLTLYLPSSLEANITNTKSMMNPNGGMAIIGLGVDTKDLKGVSGSDFIEYYYQAEATDTPTLLTSISPANENEVLIISMGMMDDETGLREFTPVTYMYMNMAGDGDGGTDENMLAKYQLPGYYTLVIPDGAFQIGDQLLNGTTITYKYSAEVAEFNYTYTLDPKADSKVENAEEAFGNGKNATGIKLTIEGAKFIDCQKQPATLTCPDGTTLTQSSPKCGSGPNVIWNFPATGYVWEAGTYTFNIKKGAIGVDMGWYEDDWQKDEGNFPGLTAIYTAINGTLTGIHMIGVDAADSYTVYTIDGKVVKLNAKADEMLDLQPGLYIINGKKAFISK